MQEQPQPQKQESKPASKPVSFEDAMLEVWPQLKNPKPLVKQESKVQEQKPVNNDVKKPVKNEQRHSYKKDKPQKAVKSKNSRKGFRK